MRKAVVLSLAVALNAGVFELGEVEVIAQDEARSTVEVVDSISLMKNEIKDISELSKIVPGVYMEKKGGRAESNLMLRGFDSRRVPIYIDGIPMYVPYDRNFDLGRFKTFDLARVDISKGASSVLYGANTMGGAINLVTKRPTKELDGDIGYGLNFGSDSDTFGNEVYFNVGSKQELFYVQMHGSFMEQNGRQMSGDYTKTSASDENGGSMDRSYSKDMKFGLKFAYTPNETDEYALVYSMMRANKEQPMYQGRYKDANKKYWDWPKYDKDSIYFLSHTEFDSFYLKTKAFYDTFKYDLKEYKDRNFATLDDYGKYDDKSYGFGFELGAYLSEANTLKFAFNYKRDEHKEHSLNEPIQKMSDDFYSFGLEDTHYFSDMTRVIVGISYDVLEPDEMQDWDKNRNSMIDFKDYGGDKSQDAFNYQIALKHSFDERDELTISHAKKTYFPSMKDRYTTPRQNRRIANPNLEPEEAYHYEIAYARQFTDQIWAKAAIFYSEVDNAVSEKVVDKKVTTNKKGKTSTTYITQKQNIGEAEYMGFEFAFAWTPVSNFEFGGNYSYIDAEYKNSENRNDIITDLPEHKAFLYADYAFTKELSIYISQEISSGFTSSVNGTDIYHKLPGYGVTNLKFTYEPVKDLTLDFGISNLFDKNYEYSEGFYEDGRVFYSNVRYSF